MSLFRRRGIESQAIPEIDEPFDPDAVSPPPAPGGDDGTAADWSAAADLTGPVDVSQAESDGRQRIDFGSLLIPAVDGMQVRVELNDQEEPVAISVVLGDTSLQLQAFAAPRSEGIWGEVRQEIAEGIRRSQGKAREADGPFGRELRAVVPVQGPPDAPPTQDVRFIGVDGPRWFLRGLVSGAGGADPAKAEAVEQVFAAVAVRRGGHAAPPREPLPLSIPEESGLLSQEPPETGR